MAYEQKDNSGAAFVNKNKTTDKHPDYTGKIMVAGDLCYLDIWRKTPKAGGAEFLSVSVKSIAALKTAAGKPLSEPKKPEAPQEPFFNDDIDF